MNTAAELPPLSYARFASIVRGTLLGGALGDQLGSGRESAERTATGPGPHFSGATQLTLYTLDGLLEVLEWANEGVAADETACLWLAYLRWYQSQGQTLPANAPVPQPRWIDAQEVLRHRRDVDEACLSGLATGTMGMLARPVNPGASGAGALTRSAPFGLLPFVDEEVLCKFALNGAALTHGDPAARQSAVVFALLIHHLVRVSLDGEAPQEPMDAPVYDGGRLAAAVGAAVARAGRDGGSPELAARLAAAVELAAGKSPAADEVRARLGAGRSAEEALSLAVYAALSTATAASPEDHVRAAVAAALRHDDGGSAGAVTGSIMGALYGADALPADWLAALEAPEVLHAMADHWLAATVGPQP